MTRSAVIALLLLPCHAAAAQAPVPQWTLERTVVITEAGKDPLTTVGAVLLDGRRQVYVTQPLDRSVAVFSPDGKYVRRLGREGEGPGEFRSLSTLGWLGDTLWVIDLRLSRTSFFAADGRPLGAVRHDAFVGSAEAGWRSTPTAYLRGGAVLSVPGVSLAAFRQASSARIPVRLMAADGRVLDTLAWQTTAGRALALRTPAGTSVLSSYQPFSDVALVSVSGDGRRIVVVERSAATSGGTAVFRVNVIGPSGQQLWTRSYSYQLRPLGRAAQDSVVRKLAMDMSRAFGSVGVAERAVRDALILPDFVPPVTVLIAGCDGTIWLRRENLGEPLVTWTVLDAAGAVLATVRLARDAEIKAADRLGIWVEEKDELDVPSLVHYAVRAGT